MENEKKKRKKEPIKSRTFGNPRKEAGRQNWKRGEGSASLGRSEGASTTD